METGQADIVEDRLLQALGEEIRSLREASGRTQADFAESVGMKKQYFNRVEGGRQNTSIPTLLRIADGLGVPPSTVLRGAEVRIRLVEARSDQTKGRPGP